MTEPSDNSLVMEQIKIVVAMFRDSNLVLPEPSTQAFTIIYTALSALAVLSNSLVLLAVIKNKKIRSARNIFIFNLAFSDLILAVSLPFTIKDKLSKSFPFSHHLISCRLVRTVPSVAAFMSSMTVMAVALDRHRVILRPHVNQVGSLTASLTLPLILISSCFLASPVFLHSRLVGLEELVVPPHLGLKGIKQNLTEEDSILLRDTMVCIEDWRDKNDETIRKHQRLSYTLISIFFQYVLPLLMISIIYGKIYNFLKERRLLNRIQKKKQKRTTGILLIISLLFCLSWFPFSICQILNELVIDLHDKSANMILSFLVCHLVGVSSACTNPILYGLLNYNIQKEYKSLLVNMRKIPMLFKKKSPSNEIIELY